MIYAGKIVDNGILLTNKISSIMFR